MSASPSQPKKPLKGSVKKSPKPAANKSSASAADESLEQALYAKHKKIFPRQVRGLFARLRVAGVVVLMGIFYLTPWINYAGRQAILWDLPGRKFYIFGLSFWPQDLIYLAALLIIAAFTLFFFTALAGRLWCGFACPQTVWTEVFLWIERKVEGNRSHQMKLDKAPLSLEKFGKKALKHFLWVALSLWTGYTFVGYFTPIRELTQHVLTLSTGPWETFWIFFYGFATYGNAGWLREQVCLYMCPYARFQSAMFDKNTLVISYDQQRGEQRGSRKRADDPKSLGLGDCIDCTLCVQACPTGIDIRDGLQYECIGCAACIDACNEVMEKVDYPKGLIRYTTENALAGEPTRIFRPRILIYAAVLLLLMAAAVVSLTTRIPLGLDVIRDRNSLYRETNEGLIENVYTLKILNKDHVAHDYILSVKDNDQLQLKLDDAALAVPQGSVGEFIVRLQADPYTLTPGSTKLSFVLTAAEDAAITVSESARFLAP